jgi:hypothetical protein
MKVIQMLAGRKLASFRSRFSFTGSISYNGSPNFAFGEVGYVEQTDDHLLPALTVWISFSF